MDISVEITDHSGEVLAELEEKVKSALEACGLEAEKNAKRLVPTDTGRLKNSITYATRDFHSPGNSDIKPGETPADTGEYATKSTPEKDTVYLGSNVLYAPAVELRDISHTTGKAHFFRDAIADYADKYKKIIEAALK